MVKEWRKHFPCHTALLYGAQASYNLLSVHVHFLHCTVYRSAYPRLQKSDLYTIGTIRAWIQVIGVWEEPYIAFLHMKEG